MAVKPIPDGYHTLTPYLVVQGADKVIEFLKKTFDAKLVERMDNPDGTVKHAELRIGDSMLMMGEASATHPPMPCAIYAYVTDTDAVYKRALQAGGVSLMEPANQFYGDRNAGVKDSAGNSWWIGTHIEDVSPEEMKRRAAEQAKH
ncbi:MAG TPA: VOC family protein [Patescibacteria group bacterium]|jgi:PhnB protein|nr:VOC family protein [Patescibacteria group bacterium]